MAYKDKVFEVMYEKLSAFLDSYEFLPGHIYEFGLALESVEDASNYYIDVSYKDDEGCSDLDYTEAIHIDVYKKVCDALTTKRKLEIFGSVYYTAEKYKDVMSFLTKKS